ncbi:hypothetical protein [cf. Phormidesmis sp. LEGE 11477]|uniref:hypothetical protein n=1 Tax=cf. Phormidesmis sp. LEGE 11477 TaxID=1828680 RepID=UPI0018823BE8|nr:hypothetical protein [cf. Phormidesmis sp. LEGE 11477]MBE9060390.1 hypothetical protein [cf. Phormidesmis sp. LEGE 11477]
MAQYYRFVNRRRQEVSQISLPFNFRLPYAKALERYDSEEVAAMFCYVVQHNADWSTDDDIVTEGDYGEVFILKKRSSQSRHTDGKAMFLNPSYLSHCNLSSYKPE